MTTDLTPRERRLICDALRSYIPPVEDRPVAVALVERLEASDLSTPGRRR